MSFGYDGVTSIKLITYLTFILQFFILECIHLHYRHFGSGNVIIGHAHR